MKFNKLGSLFLGGVLAIALIGCSKSEGTKGDTDDDPIGSERKYFNVVVSTSTEGDTEVYSQAFEDLSQGVISVKGQGYELPSTRTARPIASNSGEVLYNLHYGGGTISKYYSLGGDDYAQTGDITFSLFLGTAYARWTKIDDNNAILHSIASGDIVKTATGAYKKSKASLLMLNLTQFSFGTAPIEAKTFEVPRTTWDDENDAYVGRIDAPVVVGGKAYYGMSKSKLNPDNGENISGFVDYPATSLVVDYPSLENPKLISSAVGKGQNYGYRLPVAHAYKGSVYQMSREPGHLLKMTDGAYDDSYVFDLADALGIPTGVGSHGWFYVGNGIGYALYYDSVLGAGSTAKAWGVARVDIVNRTAIAMNVPDDLYLFQYQNAVVGKDGHLYMALTPVGGEGNIYIFDPNINTADGFKKGAKLVTGGGISYVGIF